MAKAKKNQKVNLATMSESAIALLSGYSVAITELKKLSDAHKADSDKISADIKTLLKESEDGKKTGTLTDDRRTEIEQLVYTLNNRQMALDVQFKEDKKPYVKAKNSALALVPQNIYDGYVAAWGDGNTALWNVDIAEFLKATGIDIHDNVVGVANFANVMRVRCSGSRNAPKSDTSGRLLAAKGQRTFDETVMKCFLDYCVVEKSVLDRAEDGTITKHIFEQGVLWV